MKKILISYPLSVRFLVCFLSLFYQLGAEVSFLGIPEINYYNRRFYGGATQNWKISQADNGLIYAANNDGILEFDGSEWRHLPKAADAIVRCVLAHQNRIYFGAYNAFGYYEYNGINDFVYHSLSKTPELSSLGDVWNIIPYNDAIVYQAHKGLVIFKGTDDVTFIPSKSRLTNAFLVNGLFLVYDELGGLMELRQGKLFEVPGGEMFAGVSIGTILPLSDRELLIGTTTQGLYVWDMRTFRPWDSPAAEFLKNANVYCGHTYNSNEFVFGTIQSGVVVTDKQGHIQLVASKDKGLQNNTVLGLEIDNEGNIWAGLDNGIARVSYNSSVSFLQGYYNLGTGYALERLDNSIYLGTNQGLYQIDSNSFNNPLKDEKNFLRIPGTSGQVWTLFTDYENQLLCGHNSGVFVVDGKNAQLITPPYIVGAWKFRYPPNRNDILIVGSYNGLLLLKKENGKWVFKKRLNGFDESSRFMEWDKDGDLWISHGYQGVYKLKFNNEFDEITKVQSFKKARGLEENTSLSVSMVNGEVVFSSSKGIYGYDSSAESFYRHKWNSFFLQNDYPFYLVGDKFSNIWFFAGTEAGVLRRLEDGTYTKVVNPFFNLKGKFVNGFEFVNALDQHNAVFGVEDGFAHYSVSESKDFLKPYNVHIREFRSLNEKTAYYYSGIPENQENKPSYAFSNNSFEVTFSATGFESPYIQYSTYLQGFDTEWQPYTSSRKRQFTKIEEGTYTFWVKAINIQGLETEVAGFQFTVQPPWFRTTLAKAFYLFLLIVVSVGAWKLLNWLIDRSRLLEIKKQKEAFRITEEQLKNKALESEKEMIKLRNEKLNSEMVYKEKELANSTMHIIQKNEFLQKIKDELLKLVKYREFDNLDKKVNSLVHKIDKDIDNDSHWEVFEIHLEQVHEDFLNRLREKHTDLSAKELKLSAYLRMNMSSKEISSLMNISVRAVENNRYKLRKKLNLDGKDNLIDYIMAV